MHVYTIASDPRQCSMGFVRGRIFSPEPPTRRRRAYTPGVRQPAFVAPPTLEDCLVVLEQQGGDAKIVAGATAVSIMLRQRLLEPDVLVSVGHLPDLRYIELAEGVVRMGALVTHAEVARSPLVREAVPLLSRSFEVVGNVRVRAAATVGGVLAEADYASDPPTALLALDAAVVARSRRGERIIPIANFFLDFYETVLKEDELITEVRVPVPPPGTVGVYEKFKTRSSEDRPCVGVAVLVRRTLEGRCEELRVAVGAASEVPVRLQEVDASAAGRTLTSDLAAAIAAAYASEIDTLDDARGSARFRTEMIRVWVRRAILEAAGIDP